MPVYLLLSAFTIWMAVEAIRRGQAGSWLWIILFFGPIGAAVYFFSEYLALRWTGGSRRKVGVTELRHARADTRRLDNAATWTHLASLLRIRGEFGKAVEAATRAVERDARSRDAHYELALAHLGVGRPALALPHLEPIVKEDPFYDAGDALRALAEAEKETGDFAAARRHFEQLSQRHARPEILYSLAETQARLGDRDAAASTLQRILDDAELVPDYMRRNVKPWVKKASHALKQMGQG